MPARDHADAVPAGRNSGNVEVRPARPADLAALTGIYNHHVENTAVCFDIEPFSVEARAPWFSQFGDTGRYRIFVAETGGGIFGYACSTRFRAKPAYDTSIETSVYVRPDDQRRGIGAALYGALFAALEGQDLRRAYAAVTLPNEASVALHRRFGFREVATFSEVGRKFGRYWDIRWMERALP